MCAAPMLVALIPHPPLGAGAQMSLTLIPPAGKATGQ
jgi:hypothetical protein